MSESIKVYPKNKSSSKKKEEEIEKKKKENRHTFMLQLIVNVYYNLVLPMFHIHFLANFLYTLIIVRGKVIYSYSKMI